MTAHDPSRIADETEFRECGGTLDYDESNLRTILECVQAGIVIIDPSTHTIVSVNRSAAEMIGARPDEIVGRVCHRYVCPAQQGNCPVTDCGQVVDSAERMLMTADGTLKPILKTVAPVILDGQTRLIESFLDISMRKDMEKALTAEKERLSVLNRAAVEISHCRTIREVQAASLRLAAQALQSEAVALWLPSLRGAWHLVASPGLSAAGRARLRPLLSTPEVQAALEYGRPTYVTDGCDASEAEGDSPVFCRVAVIPLVSRRVSLGALCLAARADHLGEVEDLALAEGIASQIAVALENARCYEDARFLAERDSLTGLLNHRGFTKRLEQEAARAARAGGTFTVVMMDVDSFKLFNDTWGHIVGDRVLRRVAHTVSHALRRSDTVARYGGDEFIALLPDTDARSTVRIIERLRDLMGGGFILARRKQRVPLKLSYGVASYPYEGRKATELLAAADANLYRSKQRGGDAITAPGDEVEPRLARTGVPGPSPIARSA